MVNLSILSTPAKKVDIQPAQTSNALLEKPGNPSSGKAAPPNPSAAEWIANASVRHNENRSSLHGDLRDESFQVLRETQDRQNHVLQQLVKQQQQGVMALTLPKPSMQIFNGDSASYCEFTRAFEHLVERKITDPSTRLYYLVQYTSGHVQDLMKSCLSMNPAKGYKETRRLLKERYGQAYKIASCFQNCFGFNGNPKYM